MVTPPAGAIQYVPLNRAQQGLDAFPGAQRFNLERGGLGADRTCADVGAPVSRASSRVNEVLFADSRGKGARECGIDAVGGVGGAEDRGQVRAIRA